METIVKKLNEIADAVAGEDVEDATNVADALVDIGNAFAGSESEKTNSVVEALDYIKENVSGGSGIEWRNFTLYIEQDAEFDWVDSGYICFPYYNEDNQLEVFTDAMNEWPDVQCKLPVINGKCEMMILWNITQLTLQDESSGCTLTQRLDGWYTLTITENDAFVSLLASQLV